MNENNADNLSDHLAKLLGLTSIETEAVTANATVSAIPLPLPSLPPQPKHVPITVPDTGDAIADDASYARTHLYDTLEKTHEAIAQLMIVAHQSQSARSYEVLNQLLNTQAEVSRALLQLHLDKQKVTGTPHTINPGTTTIANAIFVGTSSQLLELMEGKKQTKEEERNLVDAEFLVDD